MAPAMAMSLVMAKEMEMGMARGNGTI
jgi:hypothetical protein